MYFSDFLETRSVHGQNAILLLTILVQYRKYETANPYGVKLSILDQELSLHGYGQVRIIKKNVFNLLIQYHRISKVVLYIYKTMFSIHSKFSGDHN